MDGCTEQGVLIVRSHATDCREPCQDRDIAALSEFASCAMRVLYRSHLFGYHVGVVCQSGCTALNIQAVFFKRLFIFCFYVKMHPWTCSLGALFFYLIIFEAGLFDLRNHLIALCLAFR